MSDHPSTTNVRSHQRAYLDGRRTHLAARANALRRQAMDHWRKAWDAEQAGWYGLAQELEAQARGFETALARVSRVLKVIDDELGP